MKAFLLSDSNTGLAQSKKEGKDDHRKAWYLELNYAQWDGFKSRVRTTARAEKAYLGGILIVQELNLSAMNCF